MVLLKDAAIYSARVVSELLHFTFALTHGEKLLDGRDGRSGRLANAEFVGIARTGEIFAR